MDRVRFGRALGEGARATAAALWRAGEAAGAPAPTPSSVRPVRSPVVQPGTAPAPASARKVHPVPAGAADRVQTAARELRAASSRVSDAGTTLRSSVLQPAIRLSGVVWLEVTGSLFALFALGAAIETWRVRGALWPPGAHRPEGNHALFGLGILLVFGFFSVSNFRRAARRAKS